MSSKAWSFRCTPAGNIRPMQMQHLYHLQRESRGAWVQGWGGIAARPHGVQHQCLRAVRRRQGTDVAFSSTPQQQRTDGASPARTPVRGGVWLRPPPPSAAPPAPAADPRAGRRAAQPSGDRAADGKAKCQVPSIDVEQGHAGSHRCGQGYACVVAVQSKATPHVAVMRPATSEQLLSNPCPVLPSSTGGFGQARNRD